MEFVGHPLVDLAKPSAPRGAFLRGLGLEPQAPTVAILPGQPAERGQPDSAGSGRGRPADSRPRFPARSSWSRARRIWTTICSTSCARGLSPAVIVEGDTDAVLASADVALTASGTATVQTALHDTPMVIVYRMSPLTYRLGRRLVKLDTFGMVNLIAGERIVPELIQDAFTPEAVADEAVSMLTDPARAARIREGLARVRARLGGPGASRRAAQAILKLS